MALKRHEVHTPENVLKEIIDSFDPELLASLNVDDYKDVLNIPAIRSFMQVTSKNQIKPSVLSEKELAQLIKNCGEKKKRLAPIAEEAEQDEPLKKDVFSAYFDDVNKKRDDD
ncbi:MAG: hypothetical protein LBK44_04015 [Spirochaetales bacterium]|jgi:hypothetical protein|nr:hypothetical protein [Spirochaetales bacterium]